MDIVSEIERGLQKPGKSKSGLAKALSKSNSVVTEILRKDGKPRQIKANEVKIIRDYLELDPVAPIVGRVLAGTGEVYFAQNSDSPDEYVPIPTGGGSETVAVVIEGDSLGAGFNGWVAYYNDRRSPLTSDLLHRLCIVETADGRVMIKIPKPARQRDRYHLHPNSGGEVITDAKIVWAARVIDLRPRP